jgi:hypothetical protein
MKASTKSALFAFAAAALSAVMTAPASAQVFKPRDQTCDNPSTARDKSLKPETRCLKGGPLKEKYQDQQAQRISSFVTANPPKTSTVVPNKDGSNRVIVRGKDGNGVPYQIVYSGSGTVGYGSAAGINPGKGGGGSTKGRSPR